MMIVQGPLLDQFLEFAKRAKLADTPLTTRTIEFFLREFLTKKTFMAGGNLYFGASYRMQFPLNIKLTTDEHVELLLPQMIEIYTKEFGAPTGTEMAGYWSTAPFSPATPEEKARADYIKNRIVEYNRVTLPFRVRKTMYHKIHAIGYSFSSGRVLNRNAPDADPVIIETEEQAMEFLSSKTYGPISGALDEGFRDLWFEYTSETGDNPKFGVLDFDNPADLPLKEVKAVVRKACDLLKKSGRKYIIMFSGRAFQVWFTPNETERFDHIKNVKEIAEGIGKRAGAYIGNSNKYRDMAIANQKVYLDLSVLNKKSKLGFFFGMHFKPNRVDQSTGLVRVPLVKQELTGFRPLRQAHPEYVLENFDSLKARVDMFCQEAELGEGFPFNDSGYPCYRTPRDKPDTKHPLTKILQDWKYKPGFTESQLKNVGVELLMSEHIVLTPKYDGWVGLLAYNRMGGFKVNGQSLDSTQKVEGFSGKSVREKQKAVMCVKGGQFSWDNYLTKEFERACQANGLSEAIVIGEIHTFNSQGRVAGVGAISSILNKQEGDPPAHDDKSFRRLKFIITDVISLDNSKVSTDIGINHRLDLVSGFDTDRISTVPYKVIEDDQQLEFDTFWKKNVTEKGHEGVVAYANGRRYKVKRKYTIDAAIVGIDTSSKTWQDQKKVLSTVLVAVTKNTQTGPIYVGFQLVGNFKMSMEERQALFHKVLGEQKGDWGNFEHAVPSGSFANILPVEPRVVVEIAYTGLGNDAKIAYGFYKEQSKRRTDRRGFKWRTMSKPFYSRKLLGTPTILRERTDKSADSPQDIRATQADGAGGLSISKTKRSMVSETLENPPMRKVTHVRMNPMHGYAAGPRWVASGGQSTESPTVYFRLGMHKKAGHPAFRDDVKLSMQNEFAGRQHGNIDWRPHWSPDVWNAKRQSKGTNYYPDMTGLPLGMQDAIYDERGPIIARSADKAFPGQLSVPKRKETISDHYHYSSEQAALDAELQSDSMLDTEESDDRVKLVGKAMQSKRYRLSDRTSGPEPVLPNPMTTNDNWNKRVQKYRRAYKEWLISPEPKPDWKSVALENFEAWEYDLLEKGRKYLDAEDEFKYSQTEETIIHTRLGVPEAGEDHIFASLTLDLEDDEDDTRESDSPTP